MRQELVNLPRTGENETEEEEDTEDDDSGSWRRDRDLGSRTRD